MTSDVEHLFTYLLEKYLFRSSAHWKVYIYLCALSLSCGMWDLVPWQGIQPRPPALGAQSFSHWTTREVPSAFSFSSQNLAVCYFVVTYGPPLPCPYQCAPSLKNSFPFLSSFRQKNWAEMAEFPHRHPHTHFPGFFLGHEGLVLLCYRVTAHDQLWCSTIHKGGSDTGLCFFSNFLIFIFIYLAA